MYGSPSAFRPRGGDGRGRGGRKPSPPPATYYTLRNPNSNPHHPFAPTLPSSPFPATFHHWQQNPNFQTPSFSPPPRIITREMVEAAVSKAQSDLLLAGENVSVWNVTQSASLALQVSSWDSLGLRFNDIPYLRDLQFVEGKVNAFVHCFVSVRRMTSVHELELEICKSEGIGQFGELGLGPLLRHPLVRQYFLIPPDLKEVCKITIDDLISRLSVFLYRVKNKEFEVEEFIDFLMQKYSAPARENLGIRIQSMGLYIKFIKGARREESSALKSIQERGLLKEQHERQTYQVPDPVNSLSFLFEEYLGEFGWSNVRNVDDTFASRCCQCCPAQKKKGKKHGCCKCKGSPFVDDLKLIGIKLAMFNHVSTGKSTSGNVEEPESYGAAAYEIMKIDPSKSHKLNLTAKELDRFIATWKGACQKHLPDEVLSMMLSIYRSSDKQKRKMQRLFLQYPAVGLLNLAVRALKGKSFDFLAQATDENRSINHSSTLHIELDKSESSSDNDPMPDDEKCPEVVEKNVILEDIIKQIGCYFEMDSVPGTKNLPLEKQLVLRDCEKWLKERFLVNCFECLGHGSFFSFIEKHASVLPSEVNFILNGIFHQKPIEVFMSQRLFSVVLSQASRNLSKNSKPTEKHISMLLRKQFPSVALQMTESGSDGSSNRFDSQRISDVSFSVAFSMSLLGNCCGKNSFLLEEKLPRNFPEKIRVSNELSGILGSVSAEDAIESLLKAPMLSDLQLWSHWDVVFSPSLGPLLDWLLDLGCVKELSCIVTTDGKIIRIDHSATADGFLEALAQGSSFNTALKLLSLFHVYGGSKSVPLSLLRCYAQNGIDAIIKSCLDDLQANTHRTFSAHRTSLQGQNMHSSYNDSDRFHCSLSSPTEGKEGGRIYNELSLINRAHTIVSFFILDCLGYLPSEFRSFIADILLSAFQFFTRDAAIIILKVCRGVNERIMLHEIGLALGTMDWIEDYKKNCSTISADTIESSWTWSRIFNQSSAQYRKEILGFSRKNSSNSVEIDAYHEDHTDMIGSHLESCTDKSFSEQFCDKSQLVYCSVRSGESKERDAAVIIEKIRSDEFGLGSDLGTAESNLLKKQHARLGRALHCLSQELYSQDSHFILELVQNADDNNYHRNVEPTLVFILHSSGIIIMNNELGFSDKNIRALCDVGNSTKKGSNGGYIGQKGIGFKSVFRITDAPEIHSNGFHVKFDIADGQIGFVLPTVIPPCDIDYIKKKLLNSSEQYDSISWNTCIVLPFKSSLKQRKGIGSIISMFADLHPSLLLFLHRLECIIFKNMLDDKFVVMRREILRDGLVMVSHGSEKLSWLVVHKTLQASLVRPDVQTTKIAMAFAMEQSGNSDYTALLAQQSVFAFLPLRKYGLKFIIQGDFVLPSSREEVDEDSAWNQWLLSEMPDLFVSAEKTFCALSCFKEHPAKAITNFMSFVPLADEVYGFFSPLPQMILSKLRLSNCLLPDGPAMEWVSPCRVLRSWSEQLRTFLTDDMLKQHLGLSYLNKDIILPDSLARAIGIQEYGPKILIELLSSICQDNGIKELGLEWLSSWLNALYATLITNSSGYLTSGSACMESDLLSSLRKIPFIPLSDGSYCSLEKGSIWFPCNISDKGSEAENVFRNLPGLCAELRTVTYCLFSKEYMLANEENGADNIVKVLYKVGVQKLSAHDVCINYIFPSIYDEKTVNKNLDLMIEYLVLIMVHLKSSCFECNTERERILYELQKRVLLLTNYGYVCPAVEPIHFSEEFGNPFNVKELVDGIDIKWNEVDTIYFKHSSSQSLSLGLTKWREFLKELGVTDFVQVNQVERNIIYTVNPGLKSMTCQDNSSLGELLVNDYESPELVSLLSFLSSNECLEKNRYMIEILDKMWDDHFSAKARCHYNSEDQRIPFQSSFMKCIDQFKWVACSFDEDLHCPKDLFYDCETVHSLLGASAPYAVPQVTSKRFVEDIGFKVSLTLDDAFRIVHLWRDSRAPSASISQMSKFYTFIRDELAKSEGSIFMKFKKDIFIFIPFVYNSNYMDVVPGVFVLPHQLYWHDPTGCLDRIREASDSHNLTSKTECIPWITLDSLYPELHDFLLGDCGVPMTPAFCRYIEILLHLSSISLPSDVTPLVFKVFLKWSDDLNSGLVRDEDILQFKDALLKLENTVLPTVQGKWVSRHPCFGLVCWSNDEKLVDECVQLDNVNILYFGKLTDTEKEMLHGKVADFMKKIGIPLLAEVVSREAIFYGPADSTKETSLINWILPYAQRYIFKLHSDIYYHLKESGFSKLTQFEVIVVEQLFYRNSLQGNSRANQKRHECKSLLQVNRLYTTPHGDTHSMFLELSRFFFNGAPNLPMANFLHIVTKEFGSTEEHIESFIVNNLNVPKLPEGEPIWSLVRSPKLNYDLSSTLHASPVCKHQRAMPRSKPSSKLNWPPINKDSMPGLHTAVDARITNVPEVKPGIFIPAEGRSVSSQTDDSVRKSSKGTLPSYARSRSDISSSNTQGGSLLDSVSFSTKDTSSPTNVNISHAHLHEQTVLSAFIDRDRLFLYAPEESQSYNTGRLGEMVAFKYFSEKLGQTSVKWVNEKSEMGFPYDLTIEEDRNTRFVEVKATTSISKDWFPISTNEWHCALEKGESYSIAWVILSSQSDAQIHVLDNPLKLCQQRKLQLALLMPEGLYY